MLSNQPLPDPLLPLPTLITSNTDRPPLRVQWDTPFFVPWPDLVYTASVWDMSIKRRTISHPQSSLWFMTNFPTGSPGDVGHHHHGALYPPYLSYSLSS